MTKAQTITIELTERELKDVKLIRNYFRVNDKTCHQHFLYSIIDMLIKKSQLKPQGEIKIGEYHLSNHGAIPSTNQINVLWIKIESGEGMSIDLDKLWKDNY